MKMTTTKRAVETQRLETTCKKKSLRTSRKNILGLSKTVIARQRLTSTTRNSGLQANSEGGTDVKMTAGTTTKAVRRQDSKTTTGEIPSIGNGSSMIL
jgi:hypothetical protein